MNISLIGNSALRIAIQRNLVSYPAQIPAFMKRPGDDSQQRIAHLYFSRGWPIRNICARYGLGKPTVQRLLSEWRIRAVEAGFIQDIHPEDLDLPIHLNDEAEMPFTGKREAAYSQEVQLPPSGAHARFFRTSM